MSDFVLWLIIVFDALGAISLLYILLASETRAVRHYLVRAAYVLGVIGLIGQAYKSYSLIEMETHLRPEVSSFWLLCKDMSLLCFAVYYLIKLHQRAQKRLAKIKPS